MAMVSTSSSRPYHIIIFGASGFTGQFVIEEVARTSSEGPKGTLKWAIAGRSRQKLEKVLEQAAGALSMYCKPICTVAHEYLFEVHYMSLLSHLAYSEEL